MTRRAARGTLAGPAAAAGVAACYMIFESQWLRMREASLGVPGLPPAFRGLSVLHLSDIHADQPGLNLWTLSKAVRWARQQRPDLVVLTGDVLSGTGRRADLCLRMLGTLDPPLGAYAVPGNHEYGLSKNPLAHVRGRVPWESAGITLLRDDCVLLEAEALAAIGRSHGDPRLTICGADYITGGHGLEPPPRTGGDGPRLDILLIHRPPNPGHPLAGHFDLAFAGHTHGGQIRLPGPGGPTALRLEGLPYVQGEHPWGRGQLAISRGIGTTFLPFRLLTRPEVCLYRLEDAATPTTTTTTTTTRGGLPA